MVDRLDGDDFMKQAEKKMKSNLWEKIGIGSKSERLDQACELFKQAANAYKLQKKWDAAAHAYLQCSEIERENKSGEQADYLIEAANMQRKINMTDALISMGKAVDILCAEGKISQAARLRKSIAEIYESEFQWELAAKNYKEAIDLYHAEGDNSSNINNLMLKVAELDMLQENYDIPEAIKIYEKVADKYLENKLTASSARDLFFRACLLYLALDDTVGAENAIEKYSDKEPSYMNSRECKFIKSLIKCIEDKNLDYFSTCCYDFNSVMPLDKWKTTILNKVKILLENSIRNQISVV